MKIEKNAVVYYNKEEARYIETDPKYEYASNEDFAKELSKRLDLNYGDVEIVLGALEDLIYDYLSITNWEQNVGVWITKNICLKSAYDPEHLISYDDDSEYKLVPEGFEFNVSYGEAFEKKCTDRLKNSRALVDITAKLNKRKTEIQE